MFHQPSVGTLGILYTDREMLVKLGCHFSALPQYERG
jgi:hypothetical protein